MAVAVFRVFGAALAEMPLVATRSEARRQGHCRVLLAALEATLARAGVQKLCLPAAAEAVGTWMHGFGFEEMAAAQLQVVRAELRLLFFPGTTVLCKPLPHPPGGAPIAIALAERPATQPQVTSLPPNTPPLFTKSCRVFCLFSSKGL